MDELSRILGNPKESTSKTLPLCVTPTMHSKFKKLMAILEARELKRQGLSRIKTALEREIDEMLKISEVDQAS